LKKEKKQKMNQKSVIKDLRQRILELQKRNKELTKSCENFSEVDTNLWKRIGLLREENRELKLRFENVVQKEIVKIRHISNNCGKLDSKCDYRRDGKCNSKKHGFCIFRKIEDWRVKEAAGN